MKKGNLAAAALMLPILFVHVFAGGPAIHVVIQSSEPSEYRGAIRAVLWQAVTVTLGVFALPYFWRARQQNKALAMVMIATQLEFAALPYGMAQR